MNVSPPSSRSASAEYASATTSFTASGMAGGETRSATFRCTVTDVLGSTATDEIDLTLSRASGTGGA